LYRNESDQEWRQFGGYAEIPMLKPWQAVCRTAEAAGDQGRDKGHDKETATGEAVTGRDKPRVTGVSEKWSQDHVNKLYEQTPRDLQPCEKNKPPSDA